MKMRFGFKCFLLVCSILTLTLFGVISTGVGDAAPATVDLPTISFENSARNEGADGPYSMVFTVTLSSATSGQVQVDYTTSDLEATSSGSFRDYNSAIGTLIFPPGVTSRQITVTIEGDRDPEPNESFELRLSNPVNAILPTANAVRLGTIINDDLPYVSVDSASVVEGTGPGVTQMIFTASVDRPYNLPASFSCSFMPLGATQGVDYIPPDSCGVIPAGAISITFSVQIIRDNLDEPNEGFLITIVSGSRGLQTVASGTIIDDDVEPALLFAGTRVVEGTGAGTTTAIFTATLTYTSNLPISVTYSTSTGTASDTEDYTSAQGTLVIPAGNLTGTISVNIVRDNLDENDETFSVKLTNPVNVNIGDSEATSTIIDDDTATLTLAGTTVVEGTGAGTTIAIFTATLSTPSSFPISVTYNTSDETATALSDYKAANGVLFIAPSNLTTSVGVRVVRDGLDENDEMFRILLSNPVSVSLAVTSATATIVDDDNPTTNCNALIVTQATDDGLATVCGTFSYALAQPITTSNAYTVTFALAGSNTITFTGELQIAPKPGVTIDGSSAGSANFITLNGNNVAGDGLRLSGSNRLRNLIIRGFSGRQLINNGTNNRLELVRVVR